MTFSVFTTSHPDQWIDWLGRNVEVSDGSLTISSEPTLEHEKLGFEAVDIDIDTDGTLYAISPAGMVHEHDPHRNRTRPLGDKTGDGSLAAPKAICVDDERVYLDDADTGVIEVRAARSGDRHGRFDVSPGVPVSLVSFSGNVYRLVRDPERPEGRVEIINPDGKVASIVSGLLAPSDLAVDDSGTIYVLENHSEGPVISRHHPRDRGVGAPPDQLDPLSTFDFDDGTSIHPTCLDAIATRSLLLAGRLSRTDEPVMAVLHVDDHRLERCIGEARAWRTLRIWRQESDTDEHRFVATDDSDQQVYAGETSRRFRRHPSTDSVSGVAYRRFDSGIVDTTWHRISTAIHHLESNAGVEIRYRATNAAPRDDARLDRIESIDPDAAAALHDSGIEGLWDLLEREPADISRIVDGPSTDRVAQWQDAAIAIIDAEGRQNWNRIRPSAVSDALFDDAEGRYLQVGLVLTGTAVSSPRISSVRVYCPRQSYLRYLPEVFQEDASSVAFLERFLSVFESTFVDIERDIEAVTRLMDPQGVPSEYLPWLADWLAIEFDDRWPEAAKREFLGRAPALFKQRGTKAGLRSVLDLYLGHVEAPDTEWMAAWRRERILQRSSDGRLSASAADAAVERIDDRDVADAGEHLRFVLEHRDLDAIDESAAKRPFEMHMDGPRSFVVFVGPFVRRHHGAVIDRIVAAEKPAYVHGAAVELRQDCKLAGGAFLGINTTLTPRHFVLGRSTLGGDTVLEESDAGF